MLCTVSCDARKQPRFPLRNGGEPELETLQRQHLETQDWGEIEEFGWNQLRTGNSLREKWYSQFIVELLFVEWKRCRQEAPLAKQSGPQLDPDDSEDEKHEKAQHQDIAQHWQGV